MVPRFALAALLIAATAIFLHAHSRGESFPTRLPLQSFPDQIGPWSGIDREIGPDQLKVLGNGEFLLREYQGQPSELGVNLFIAYYRSQRDGETPHSPQNCLPGSGWMFVENKRVMINMSGHEPFPANRDVIAQGETRQIMLYWFWAHNHGVASEFWNKYYLVKDAIHMNRTDGALVRIVSYMLPGETAEQAQKRISPFVDSVLPMLNDYIPR